MPKIDVFLSIILAAFLGYIFFKLRGGWWHNLTDGDAPKKWWNGTQAMRLIWSVPTAALMMDASHAPMWLWPVLIVTVFIGQALFGTGQYLQDDGLHFPDTLGFYRNALSALPAFYFSPLLFIVYSVFGFFHAGLYWLGYRMGGNGDYGQAMLGSLSWVLIVAVK